jgi:PAS domain S-box-containing protein
MTKASKFADENDPLMLDKLQDDDSEQAYTSLKRSLSRITNHQQGDQREQHPMLDLPRPSQNAADLHIDIPQLPMAAEIALVALQYLPTPLIVLSSLKTILLANEAMGRLLGLKNRDEQDLGAPSSNAQTISDILRGQKLSQIGVDIMQDGTPVWVSWDKFLDNLANKLDSEECEKGQPGHSAIHSGETTPVPAGTRCPPSQDKTLVHDIVVDVVVSAQKNSTPGSSGRNRHHKPRSPTQQTPAKMIVSIWRIEDQRFFSLSFTSTPLVQQKSHSQSHIVSRPPVSSSNSHLKTNSVRSSTPTSSRSSSAHSSGLTSPTDSNFAAPFLPYGVPAKCSQPGKFTDFEKITKMKDAMLSAMEIPVLAMWKDESVVFPNPAARRMLAVIADPTTEDSYDFCSRFKAYTADFERELRLEEIPMSSLCSNQKGFSNWQIGMIEPRSGKRRNYDVSGKPVFDEKTGDFFAGLVAFKDVTAWSERLASQSEENEQQFQLICNSMPQMLWTTRPDGYHDYFSQRWYDYTGLSVSECYGLGWKLPFHPDDMPETGKRWQHSLSTGDEYTTEYRCQRHDGEWRWMLGRALPLRDSRTGEILKWFGSCTDIQEV